MMTGTMTLTDFLLARIAEDEAAARAAADACLNAPSHDLSDHWEAETLESVKGPFGAVYGAPIQATRPTAFAHTVAHIALHDPARVLADCEAKRRIVEAHPRSVSLDYCETCFTGDHGRLDDPEHEPWPCPTIRALALPYADHPDYRSEWRP